MIPKLELPFLMKTSQEHSDSILPISELIRAKIRLKLKLLEVKDQMVKSLVLLRLSLSLKKEDLSKMLFNLKIIFHVVKRLLSKMVKCGK